MDREKQIEEMAKREKCEKCIHSAVCEELEEYRNPLGFINTKGEWVCSYYESYCKDSEVAREIFDDILKIKGLELHDWEAIFELKKKYTDGR